MDETTFFIELLTKGYVNVNKEIMPEKYDALLADYPELNGIGEGVNTNRIINRNSERKNSIHIRKALFNELRELWSQLNRKYIMYFDREIDKKLEEALPAIIKDKQIFSLQTVESTREELRFQDKTAYMA